MAKICNFLRVWQKNDKWQKFAINRMELCKSDKWQKFIIAQEPSKSDKWQKLKIFSEYREAEWNCAKVTNGKNSQFSPSMASATAKPAWQSAQRPQRI